mgnify:CR=1 FL=1
MTTSASTAFYCDDYAHVAQSSIQITAAAAATVKADTTAAVAICIDRRQPFVSCCGGGGGDSSSMSNCFPRLIGRPYYSRLCYCCTSQSRSGTATGQES